MSIAYDHLEPYQRAQLFHFYPELRNGFYPPCQKCGGQVLKDYDEFTCLQCGTKHDKQGNYIEPVLATGLEPTGRTPTRRRIR